MLVDDVALELLTLGEAAEYIGVTYKAVHLQVQKQRIATVPTYGGSRLITLGEARRYKSTVSMQRGQTKDAAQLLLPLASA